MTTTSHLSTKNSKRLIFDSNFNIILRISNYFEWRSNHCIFLWNEPFLFNSIKKKIFLEIRKIGLYSWIRLFRKYWHSWQNKNISATLSSRSRIIRELFILDFRVICVLKFGLCNPILELLHFRANLVSRKKLSIFILSKMQKCFQSTSAKLDFRIISFFWLIKC